MVLSGRKKRQGKQLLGLAAGGQVLQQLPGIIQFATTDPERDQQSRGRVDSGPDPDQNNAMLK